MTAILGVFLRVAFRQRVDAKMSVYFANVFAVSFESANASALRRLLVDEDIGSDSRYM